MWTPISPKKWNGSNWVDAQAYKWDGDKWVNVSTQQHVKTWDSTWTQSYGDENQKRTGDRALKLSHGYYPNVDGYWGIMRSLCGFGDIAKELQGAKIDKVEIYLRNEHWYYYAGGKVGIGYHNHATVPQTFSHSHYQAKVESYSARGQAKWITMPKSLGEGIRDGKYKGFSLYTDSKIMDYYGIFYGAQDGSNKPKLKITYTK